MLCLTSHRLLAQVKSDLLSLLSTKRELSSRVRVEKTGRPPEHPTQTVVQRIVKVAEEEVRRRFFIFRGESACLRYGMFVGPATLSYGTRIGHLHPVIKQVRWS